MRSTSSLVVLTLLLCAAPARADRRDPVAAEALFRAGRAAADRGDFGSACPKFEESNRLDPAVGTMLNLAACEEQLGKVASAWQLFREVAQRLPRGDERIAIAIARATALEPRLPHLYLAMANEPPGTVVLRDGVDLGSASFGLPLPVDPGEHVVIVKAAGREDRRYDLKLSIGETREIALEAGPLVAAAGVATPSAEVGGDVAADPGRSRRTFGIVALGAGGAGLLTSLVFGAVAISAKQTVNSECAAKRCSPAGLDAVDRGSMAATVSTVAFGVGIAGAALGAFLLLGASDAHPAAAGLPLSVGVAPLRDGAFVSAVGRLP
jgi:hypothetical protein